MQVDSPPLYLDNLLAPWTMKSIREEGVIRYPLLEDWAVPWTTYLGLARYVSVAIHRTDLAGNTFDIANLPMKSIGEITNIIGDTLQSKIRYQSISPESYGELVSQYWGREAAHHVATHYRQLVGQPSLFFERDYLSAYSKLKPSLETVEAWASQSLAPA